MEDNVPKENPPPDFNKLDLSQLQGFSFGTQWTQEKPSAPEARDRGERGDDRDRPRRDGPGAPDRRDRRGFRRPAGSPPGEGGGPTPAVGAPDRREPSGDRYPRREGPGEYRGGPRREGYGGGDRGSRPGYGGRGAPQDRGPYESPYYNVMFYPEDTSFSTLVQTIRKSCRTVELFEIARTVVAKTERFVVVVAHRSAGPGPAPAGKPGDSAPPVESATPAAKPARPVFHISMPDGMPFESDEAAVAHVLSQHLDKFFDAAEVEVDPPKGNFLVINKCGVTGELLGPPNYHRYTQIVQQHHAAKLPRMAFDVFRNRIETVRDPEVVNQWLAKMKKTTRYTWKSGSKPAPASSPAPAPASAAVETTDPASPPAEAPPAEVPAPDDTPAAVAPAAAVVEPAAPATPTFDSLEDARIHLLTHARDKVVRTTENVRFHGKVAEAMPPGEIRRAIEGALERQRRFPLDTANALRGRLRREHFTIFKKGAKGVSYVCAVKRKFRVPGQTFADSIGSLITFIETNPMIRASEIAPRLLGIAQLPAARPAETAAPVEPGAEGAAAVPVPTPPEPVKIEPSLSIEDRARLSRLQGDLMWLVREGYVTEFIDGRLFAPPPMVEARKKEIEAEDHDPENFPEAPTAAAEESPSTAASVPAGEQSPPPAESEPLAATEPNPAPPAEIAAPVVEETKAPPA